jgi:hypothetical protein
LKDNFLLVPLRDLFSFFFWCAALLGSRVEWRGKVFRLMRGGKMQAMPADMTQGPFGGGFRGMKKR